ncbi:MAG: Omp28-related outer membrane protein [Bacteroidales bacterium]|nr:Omp28-related outer membrane protein [Bacteroidales bacterium]
MVALSDDSSVTNNEIRIAYTGRADKAVEIVSVSPANGSAQGFFDASSNPIILTFDSPVKLSDSYTVGFYEGNYSTPKTTFTAQVGSNSQVVYLYPTSAQYMFVGSQYRVEIPEGLVTDYSDTNPNAALTLTYEGSYERQVQAEGSTLFYADGSVSSYLTWITFDGDENTPATVPASWGFTAAAAWWGVTDDTGDLCFASHSMYTPAGQSDDWMMTPQLLIPDAKCQLSFDAQSYLKSKTDYLKVYVYACDDIYNTLDKDLTATIRANADLVFNQQLSPGDSEEDLVGDWEHFVIDLDRYEGKYIYVAFVNDNTDQSAVFVDNVLVGRDLAYTMSFRHSSTVVDLDYLLVEGTITITSETETYHNLRLNLLDGDGEWVQSLGWTDSSYQKGDTQNFLFSDPLYLKKGASNTFTVEVIFDEETSSVTETVKNMMFEPVKRVVIEEYTGKSCGNCPLGILAMEKIESTYPGLVVPVILKCYESDPLGTNVQGYASYLEANAAPMGIVNRSMEWTSPMLSSDNFYYYSASQVGEDIESSELWYDQVTVALQTLADCDITIGDINYSEASRSFTAPVTVRYAMNATQQSLKLFGVILEDNLSSRQRNYFATLEAEGLGEWSAGGQYASTYVYYNFDNVARGVIGETYAGTSGLFPSTIEAGEDYTTELSASLPSDIVNDKVDDAKLVVMLIDGNTGKVINAASSYITGVRGGVEDVVADKEISGPKGIWTLMGVQLPDDAVLQPGIYIIDGKKTIVK